MNLTEYKQKRLHIGLVTPGFSASEDDWCIPSLLNLVRRLAAEHDVTVYTLRYPHADRTYSISGARVRSFGGATVRGWGRLPLLWRAIRTIIADSRQKPFSVLHGLWADEAGFVASVAARRCAVPSLVSLMGGELVRSPDIDYGVQLSRSGRLLTSVSLWLAHVVSAGSQQMLELAAPYVARERLRQAPLGVDLSLFRPGSATANASYRVLHAASLTAVKDQEMLLAAFARATQALSSTEISLHIAGDGPLRANLDSRARALGIAKSLRFHGALAHERMPGFYRSGDLFALSSRHESQSVALLEAAACGLPAVGTAVGLLPELLPESLLAGPGDDEALARAMISLMRDENVRRKEALRLQSVVRSRYGLRETVSRILEIYHELLSK